MFSSLCIVTHIKESLLNKLACACRRAPLSAVGPIATAAEAPHLDQHDRRGPVTEIGLLDAAFRGEGYGSDDATAAFARGLREGFWGGRIWVMDCFV